MAEETCRRWEEEIYWTHFQYIHFSQVLLPGYDQQLAIPENFTRNLKKKLPNAVTLRSPSGATWKVGLTCNNDVFFFNRGWSEFVKDNILKENDILIFKYNRESQFDVSMFDGLNMCEKAASYFVRKCGCGRCDSTCKMKGTSESYAEDVMASRLDVIGNSRPERSRSNDIDRTPLSQSTISSNVNKRTRIEAGPISPPGFPTRLGVGNIMVSSAEDVDMKPDIVHTSFNKPVDHTQQVPTTRPVTEEAKKHALQLAQAAQTQEGFIVVLKRSHVYKKFFVSIPVAWIPRHVPTLENQDMVLRFQEKLWSTRFYYRKDRHTGGIAGGWKDFVVDNNLQELDVCVFEPGIPFHNLIVLDVAIFRVVQQESSPTKASKSCLELAEELGTQWHSLEALNHL